MRIHLIYFVHSLISLTFSADTAAKILELRNMIARWFLYKVSAHFQVSSVSKKSHLERSWKVDPVRFEKSVSQWLNSGRNKLIFLSLSLDNLGVFQCWRANRNTGMVVQLERDLDFMSTYFRFKKWYYSRFE